MDQTTQNGIVSTMGWSWGAFMFNFYFLIAVKRYQMLWWYLLAVIPLLNVVFIIVFAIYLGVKGHAIAATGSQFANQDEYNGYMRATDHSGRIVFIVTLICTVLGIILIIAALALGFFVPHTPVPFPPPAPTNGVSTY